MRFFWGFARYILVSLLVTGFGLVVSISLLTGKFPPSWQQIKGLKKNFEAITALNKQVMGTGGISLLQQQLQNLPQRPGGPSASIRLPVDSSLSEPQGAAIASGDPDMADVQELQKHYQRQAALSKSLTGQMELSSQNQRGQQIPQGVPSAPGVPLQDPHLQERIRKLEDLVRSLHAQVYQMSQQLNQIQKGHPSVAK